MVTVTESTVKISKWLLDEIDLYVGKTKRNATDFPSKKNFVDRAVINLLEEKGVEVNT
ncbi:MAG: hypothetical protein ACI83O_000859 [Patescibacteria group bacterium]|jgi:hypothetical protein